MTTRLEEELAHTLAGAADHAPEPDGDFLVGVRRRQHARGRRRVAAVAGCAAVLAVVGGVAVTKLNPLSNDAAPVGGRDTLPVRDTPWSGTVPDFAKAGTPDQVWPAAVHKLPVQLPGGGEYRVYEVLGDDRYLVQQVTKAGAPSVFDAKTEEVTFLGNEAQAATPAPKAWDWATTVIGDDAVWISHQEADVFQIWTAPLDGAGDPRQVATLVDVQGWPSVNVSGSEVYWHQDETNGGGLLRLRVPDGDGPQAVPGGGSYASIHLSPWASTSRSAFTEDSRTEGTLWNLQTGEHRPWRTHPDAERIKCFPLLCLAWSAAEEKYVLQPLDGSRIVTVDYPWKGFSLTSAVDGGFGVGTVETSRGTLRYVWDFAAGKAGTVDVSGQGQTSTTFTGFEESILQWPAGDSEIYVLDLAAIH